MRQQPVEPDRDAGADHDIAQREDQDVAPIEQVARPAKPHRHDQHDRWHSGHHAAGDAIDHRHRDRTHHGWCSGARKRCHLASSEIAGAPHPSAAFEARAAISGAASVRRARVGSHAISPPTPGTQIAIA